MGDPVANRDLYIERSAVTFASNLRAKVLIASPVCHKPGTLFVRKT
ncbi:MAG: hypothetical protein JWN15_1671 [Firmicutes bacterium]|nr:hypothetical protein [Bacillota bacterium]